MFSNKYEIFISRQQGRRKPSWNLLDIFISIGKGDLRGVFIRFTDGADPEVACQQNDRIMIQNCIYRDCKDRRNSISVAASYVPGTTLGALPPLIELS